MPIRPAVGALVGVLMASAVPVTAQQPHTQGDSIQAQLRTTLWAFYYFLAHQDWEALSADILPAKMVAHRPAPEALVAASKLPTRPAWPLGSAPGGGDPPGCSPNAAALVDQAIVTLDGDWAEVSVPRCAATPVGADEFRLIHFEGRWWIVYIDLFRESGTGQLAR